MAESVVGHVFFEGSSTAWGYGDERRLFGYAGRIARYYDAYNTVGVHAAPEPPCRMAYCYMDGQPDRNLPAYAPLFEGRVLDALSWSINPHRYAPRVVGVFLAGGFLSHLVKHQGVDGALQSWRTALHTLRMTCERRGVAAIGISPPEPMGDVRFGNGQEADLSFFRTVQRITADHMSAWTRYVSIDAILGAEKPQCMAPDNLHVNARGYDKVAAHLLPMINARLGITPECDAATAAALAEA